MTDDKITALLDQEEKLIASAVARTVSAYNQSATVANLKDFQAAKKAYEEFKSRQAASADPENRSFKNILDVLDYLQSEGYKLGKSKLYEDQHKIDHQKDGSMLKKDVDKYASMFLRKADGSDIEFDTTEKFKWETEIAKQKAEQLTRRNEVESGIYVLRSDVEQQFAARASFLRNSLEGFFHSLAPRLIEKADGSMDRTPDVVEFCLAELDELFHRYSQPLVFAEAVKFNEDN